MPAARVSPIQGLRGRYLVAPHDKRPPTSPLQPAATKGRFYRPLTQISGPKPFRVGRGGGISSLRKHVQAAARYSSDSTYLPVPTPQYSVIRLGSVWYSSLAGLPSGLCPWILEYRVSDGFRTMGLVVVSVLWNPGFVVRFPH